MTLNEAGGVRLSTRKTRQLRNEARERQRFELNPPRCMNCEHLIPPRHGAPETQATAVRQYVPASCGIGGFVVKAWSICDRWQGVDGDSLE